VEAGGTVIAVLGNGIDIVYPRQHEKLLSRVLEKGAIITEYAPGVSPDGHHFPVRNRLISGISQAVCIVEGRIVSGTLSTARHAIYQGKTLYAVPGRIGDKSSEGTNYLLREGAIPVTSVRDIVADFEFVYPRTLNLDGFVPHISSDEAAEKLSVGSKGVRAAKPQAEEKAEDKKKAKKGASEKKEKRKKNKNPFPEEEKPEPSRADIESLGEKERKILDYMKADVPMLADEIAEGGFSISDIMIALTVLEIAGAVEAGAGGYYLKRAADYGGEPDYITEDDDGL
ncbi:MAG: DNA-processing protein DprA, partial [Clostridia bacterium]|nr:DNA-processing protein DprA [Clostridia bacterium]